MIFFWFLGDAIKMIFLLIQNQPLQFILGTGIVIAMELALLVLYYIFNKKKHEPETAQISPTNPTPLYREHFLPEVTGKEGIQTA